MLRELTPEIPGAVDLAVGVKTERGDPAVSFDCADLAAVELDSQKTRSVGKVELGIVCRIVCQHRPRHRTSTATSTPSAGRIRAIRE